LDLFQTFLELAVGNCLIYPVRGKACDVLQSAQCEGEMMIGGCREEEECGGRTWRKNVEEDVEEEEAGLQGRAASCRRYSEDHATTCLDWPGLP
jgi:hypothetical protein